MKNSANEISIKYSFVGVGGGGSGLGILLFYTN